MKLIDILVRELPKRGGWPEGATGAGFICGQGELYFWDKDDCCPSAWTLDVWEAIEDTESEISRERYESALAAKNDGWIEWGGGECPVDSDAIVDVKLKNGVQITDGEASAAAYYWDHMNQRGDIIAYRLHQPQQEDQPEASEEDLNDCIGQAPVAVWNGDGLPPVGCECEYLDSNNEWYPVTIKYASNQIVVICGMTNIFGEEQETEIAKDIQLDKPQFRPIRSEEDQKRDDRASAIDGFISGFRGQETGSNKELAYALTDYLALLDKL